MKENKDQPERISTCFEGCAEMMRKIKGEDGIGSLCQKMMRAFMKTGPSEKEGAPDAPKNDEGTGGVK